MKRLLVKGKDGSTLKPGWSQTTLTWKKKLLYINFKEFYDFLTLSPPKNIKVVGFLINFATPIVPILKFQFLKLFSLFIFMDLFCVSFFFFHIYNN